MAYIASAEAARPSVLMAAIDPLVRLRMRLREYRRKRAIYLRTLQELRSYQPHELNDLRIHPTEFEALAREQAGW